MNLRDLEIDSTTGWSWDQNFAPLAFIENIKKKTALDSAFNVGSVTFGRWTSLQQSSFIHSMFRGWSFNPIQIADVRECLKLTEQYKDMIDHPKHKDYLYFKGWADQGYDYIALEGNNRSLTIQEFFEDKIALRKGLKIKAKIDGKVVEWKLSESKVFSKLDKTLQNWLLETIKIKCTIIVEDSRDALAKIFIAQNSQSPLNSQEKRNAWGYDSDTVAANIRALSEKWKNLAWAMYPLKRLIRLPFDEQNASMLVYYTHRDTAHVKQLKSINNDALDAAYYSGSKEHEALKKFNNKANKMYQMIWDTGYGQKSQKPKKFTHMNLFMLLIKLEEESCVINNDQEFMDWFAETHSKLERSSVTYDVVKRSGKEEKIRKMQFDEMKTDDAAHLRKRLEILYNEFLEFSKDSSAVTQRDHIRIFSAEDRIDMWYRQEKRCAITGKKIPFSEVQDTDKWQADHIFEYAEGGKTIVENGQLVCRIAHQEKTAAYIREKNKKSA